MAHAARIEPTFAAAAAAPALSGLEPRRTLSQSDRDRSARIAAWAGVAAAFLLLAAPVLVSSPPPFRPTLVETADGRAASSLSDDVATTGALPHATDAAPAAVLTPERFTVLLGEGPTPETLWGWWRILQVRHRDAIGSLVASVSPAPDGGRHRLTLGPFRNAVDAADFCGRLRASGTTCAFARSDGTRL